MAPRLKADFRKRFPSGDTVDAKFSVPISPGSVVILFGPSGAGKTTILRVISGLESPDEGVISYADEAWVDPARGISIPPRLRRVGMMSQHPSLFPHKSVAGNIAYGLRGIDRQSRRRRIEEVLAVVGLEGSGSRRVSELSGGQARRVELARALAPGPKLLLLDEPLAALDTPTRNRLGSELRRIFAETGISAMIVTHELDEALMLGDHLIMVIGGETPQYGPIEEVFQAPRTLGIGRALGVETILAARVAARSNGMVLLDTGGVKLWAVGPDPLAPEVFVFIRAENVALKDLEESAPPTAEATRNHLPATVTAIERQGPLYEITLDVGFTLRSLVTPHALEELNLSTGRRVEASVKASAIHCIPRMGQL